jgi:hypothetical protein
MTICILDMVFFNPNSNRYSTWWLSSDIRLIQVGRGERVFGVLMQNDPYQFLRDLTSA